MRKAAAPLMAVFVLSASLPAQYYPRVRRANSPKSTAVGGEAKDLVVTFHGVVKELTNKEINLLNDEEQTVVIRRTRKTKFFDGERPIKATDIDLNTVVSVDAVQDVDLKPVATAVTMNPPKKEAVSADPAK